jgi:hypothetical protein
MTTGSHTNRPRPLPGGGGGYGVHVSVQYLLSASFLVMSYYPDITRFISTTATVITWN